MNPNDEPISVPPAPARLTDRTLPPYSYVPGLFPHPTNDPKGHLFGAPEPQIDFDDRASVQSAHRWAIDLFNNGYYWEAHEIWEGLWHAYGRHGNEADFVKGLIKLAAAGVKAREGNAVGVRRHARRAHELFENVAADKTNNWQRLCGMTPKQLMARCAALANQSQAVITDADDAVIRVLPFVFDVPPVDSQ